MARCGLVLLYVPSAHHFQSTPLWSSHLSDSMTGTGLKKLVMQYHVLACSEWVRPGAHNKLAPGCSPFPVLLSPHHTLKHRRSQQADSKAKARPLSSLPSSSRSADQPAHSKMWELFPGQIRVLPGLPLPVGPIPSPQPHISFCSASLSDHSHLWTTVSRPRLTSLELGSSPEHPLCPPAPLHSIWPSNCCVAPRKGDPRGELIIDVEVFVFSLIFLLFCGPLDATTR